MKKIIIIISAFIGLSAMAQDTIEKNFVASADKSWAGSVTLDSQRGSAHRIVEKIYFAGCKPQKNGCHITAQIQVLAPSGKKQIINRTLYMGPVPQDFYSYEYSFETMETGVYAIATKITDENRAQSLLIENSIER